MNKLVKSSLAEFAGTFILVFAATGGINLIDFSGEGLSLPQAATGIGIVLALIVYLFGKISGAHFNPAVSAATFLAGEMNRKSFFFYLLAQFGGAIIATLFAGFLFPMNLSFGATIPTTHPTSVFIIEAILSFLLMLVILSSTRLNHRIAKHAGIFIGGIVLVGILVAADYSGASMNPARSFGPDLLRNDFSNTWIYILAPVTGATICSLAWKNIIKK